MKTLRYSLDKGGELASKALGFASASYMVCNEAVAAGITSFEESNELKVIDNSMTAINIDAANPHIAGEYNFDFKLELKLNNNSTNCLVASGTYGMNKLHLACKWWRKINNNDIIESKNRSDIYMVTVDDINCRICVEARCIGNSAALGVAYAEIGPFEINAATKMCLDNSLGSLNTKFPIRINNEIGRSPGSIVVKADEIRIKHLTAAGGNLINEWIGRFGSVYPILEILSNNDFHIILDKSTNLQLTAVSPAQRDLIVLTIRSFQGRHFISTDLILNEMSKSLNKDQSLTQFLLIIQKLSAELVKSIENNKNLTSKYQKLLEEKKGLEEELTTTINSYQKIIQNTETTKLEIVPVDNEELIIIKSERDDMKKHFLKSKECLNEVNLKLKEKDEQIISLYKQLENKDEHNVLAKLRNEVNFDNVELLIKNINDDKRHIRNLEKENDILKNRCIKLSKSKNFN